MHGGDCGAGGHPCGDGSDGIGVVAPTSPPGSLLHLVFLLSGRAESACEKDQLGIHVDRTKTEQKKAEPLIAR